MFDILLKEQQQALALEPVKSIEKLTANLRMDELVEPNTLFYIHKSLRETF